MREREEFSTSLLHNVPNPIHVINPDLSIRYINPAMEKLTGFYSAEILGMKPPFPWWPPEQAKEYTNIFPEIAQIGTITRERLFHRKNGEPFWVEVSVIAVKDGGKLQYYLSNWTNITERKRAEEELKTRDAFLNAVIEQTPSALWLSDDKGTIIRINQALRDLLQITDAEVVGRYNVFRDRQVAEQGLVPLVKSVYTKGESVHFTINYYTKREKQINPAKPAHRILDIVMSPIKNEQGKVINVICQEKDITEQKQAEEKLQESEGRLKKAQTLGKIGSWEFDLTARQSTWSDEMYELFDISKTQSPPIPSEQDTYYSAEDNRRFKESVQSIIENGWEFQTDITAHLPNGKTVFHHTLVTPVKDNNGRVIKLFGVVQDITERKTAEAALKDSEEKYHDLVERANDGICIVKDMKVEFCNQRLGQMWGGTTEELTGKPFTNFVHPESLDEVVNIYKQRIAGKSAPRIYQMTLKRRDGSKVHTEVDAGKILYKGTFADMVIIRDITERKRGEKALEQSYEKLRKALDSAIKTIAATSEMRDPYTAGHQRRVAQLACAIAAELHLTEEQINHIRIAGLVHDIGKISIPAEILTKPGNLTDVERALVQTHVKTGSELLSNIEFPYPLTRWILEHHERMNGSGYPLGQPGDRISLEARILAVADVVEAMSSHRPYRPAPGLEAALAEMRQNKDTLYDGKVVEACLKVLEKGFKFE